MRLYKTLFIFGFLGFIFWGCGGGGGSDGDGFIPTGKIIAVAERSGSNVEIKVGGTEGAAPPGSTVEVTNLKTGETLTTTAESDGSFDPTFKGSTSDTFVVSINGTIVSDDPIGVTLISQAVKKDLAVLGSVPTAIEIKGNRAYVVNGLSNNIQVFDLGSGTPQKLGTIVVPSGPPLGKEGSDPIAIAFLNDTIAYVANLTGQSVAMLNTQTFQCELLIIRSDLVPSDARICQNQVVTVDPCFFEDPSDIAIANGKVYVVNSNLDDFFQPQGNGFITVIDTDTNEVNDDIIKASGVNTKSDTIVNTIDIKLNAQNPLVCSPNKVEPTPDGKFGYLGLGLVGALLKVDLENNMVVKGPDDPIIITDDPSELNFTADVKIRADGLGFTTLFNTDQIAVIDTETDTVNPFPFIATFPAGLKADNPDSQFFEGVQNIAMRSEGNFPDIFFIAGLSSKLGSVNTAFILPPE